MAILHKATLTPSKAELLAPWLARQPWFTGATSASLRPIASFRFDDPQGEVGIETVLAATEDGQVWHLPMTYRAEPLGGGADHLIGTLQHSVLGTRYVYDAPGDPVYLAVVRAAIAERGSEADLERDNGDGTKGVVDKLMTAHGTGGDGVDIVLDRQPNLAEAADLAEGSGALIGERDGEPAVVLARLI